MNWQPKNPYPENIHPVQCGPIRYYEGQRDGWDEGASAMLSAVIKWLDEPCDKHPLDPSRYNYWMEEHRKDCPQCMAGLRGEK